MRRVVLSAFFLIFIAGPGCDISRDGKPSILVIAVEGLDFSTLSCDSESQGMQALCEESVHFSHAFAPSTMSQATMASLMTGLYPIDHGVRNNGSDFLSARYKTLAEGALSKGYRTLFVSGGPPIWRKSGLAQGFEVFDDQVDVEHGLLYRPADDVFRIATHWIEHDIGWQPFFSVLFLADLQFPGVATRTDEGEVREKSAAGQVEEVIESLGDLFKWLKARKLWNGTNIVVVGLNSLGPADGNREPAALSLRSNSVQVSLFIKPARRERDGAAQWSVDRNVSLVDIGVTIFEWLGIEPPSASLSELQPQSLNSALIRPEPRWKADRLILTETAWPDWLEGDGVRWAIRQSQFLYIHDRKPQIFNTLTDHAENIHLKTNDPLWASLNADVLHLLQRAQTPPFKGMQSHWLEQLEVAREIWQDGLMERKPKGNEPWVKWYLRQALNQRDWRNVKRFSQILADPVGTFIAAKHLGESLPMPRNPCVRLILNAKGDKRTFQSECEDERLLALHAWQGAKNEEERLATQDRFLRLYAQSQIDQEVGRLNYLTGLRWDVDRELPEAPQLVDYILTLKEFETFARKVGARSSGG